jgi:FkbM family methyltransferase
MPTLSVVQILTASIAPAIVISGVGLLLLSISNRYGRAIDRVRLRARDLSESDPESARRRHLNEQLRLTNQRAHILKRSMLYSSMCILFVSLTILSLFAEHLIGLQRDFLALPFFALCRRFQSEIADGRLRLLNVGIPETAGESEFWISEVNHQWSSFSKEVATRRGATVLPEPVRVRCCPLSAVVQEVGTPYYLKMDIEGYDAIGLESLSKDLAPPDISVEFSDGMQMRLLQRLQDLGYFGFKLLNQVTFSDKRPIFDYEVGLRAIRKLYRGAAPFRPLIRKLVPRSDFDTFHETGTWRFPEGSSGPFGKQTYGRWMTSDQIL